MPIIFIVASLIITFVVFFLATYKVIEPNEAHIITFMGKGRRIYSPKDIVHTVTLPNGEKQSKRYEKKTAYFYIPFLMKKMVLQLTNVKMSIDNIHLNDAKVAPFICDVITWITIENPIIAAEKLSAGDTSLDSLKEDLVNIVQAVARTVSFKQEILEILKDRDAFSKAVFAEVDPLLKKWGADLVNLEVNDIRDDDIKKSTVIADYESIRKVEINAYARQQTAKLDRQAIEVEQDNLKLSKVAEAESEKSYTCSQILKDKKIGIAKQIRDANIGVAEKNKETEIAKADEKANVQKVEANRKLEVGNAEVLKESTIQTAKGQGEAIRIQGEKEAEVVTLKGEAEGNAITAKGTAEAKAKDAMAEALKKFNDAGISLEKLKAIVQIAAKKWEAYGSVAKNAEIKIVNSGEGADILGMKLNAETGADFGQMLEGIDLDKFDITKLGDEVKKVVDKTKKPSDNDQVRTRSN